MFWEGCQVNEFRLPHCDGCGRVRWYLQVRCPHCQTAAATWKGASAVGTIFAFTIVERAFDTALTSWTPYVVALIELDAAEGVRFASRIVHCEIEEVHVGMAVEVAFQREGDLNFPFFRPRRAS